MCSKLYDVVTSQMDEEEWKVFRIASVRIKLINEYRYPKKGEWYFDEENKKGYKALKDLKIPFQIGKLVKTKTKTIRVEDEEE